MAMVILLFQLRPDMVVQLKKVVIVLMVLVIGSLIMSRLMKLLFQMNIAASNLTLAVVYVMFTKLVHGVHQVALKCTGQVVVLPEAVLLIMPTVVHRLQEPHREWTVWNYQP